MPISRPWSNMIRFASLKVLCPAITADAGKRRISNRSCWIDVRSFSCGCSIKQDSRSNWSVIGLDRLQVGMCHYGTYPFVFVSALQIDPTCMLQVFCLKRRISLIIAVVNPLYKDLAAMPCADKTVIWENYKIGICQAGLDNKTGGTQLRLSAACFCTSKGWKSPIFSSVKSG